MNLLEHYIQEVHSITQKGNLVVVDVTVNCYGATTRTTHTFLSMQECENSLKKGYYLA